MNDRETRHTELAEHYLPAELLARFRERAAEYDRENRFFDEDLAELIERGYLQVFVPAEFGGPDLTLHEVSRLQQRLAGAAPATALAVNMHLLCTGVASALLARGDRSLEHVLDEAAAGEIFAFGISEPGNDWVLQGSNSVADPQPDGSYRLSGVKIFTSLSPAWTRLIAHGLDTSDPEKPQVVFGFIDRGDSGVSVSEHWDVLGMRASQSRATTLDAAMMRADRVVRRVEPGRVPDLLTFAIAAQFQLLVGSVYAGVARRCLELGAQALHRRRSAARDVTLAEAPEWRARIAEAHRAFLSVPALLDSATRDFDEQIDHGAAWPLKFVTARIAAGDAARSAAETALACSGGAGFDGASEASRLYRDAAASLFHPPSVEAAQAMYAAALLDDR